MPIGGIAVLFYVRDPTRRERARCAFEDDSSRIGRGQRPVRSLETDIYVTNVCNIKCSYCYFYYEDYFTRPSHHEPGHQPLHDLTSIIDNISGHTYCIVLLGGEPLSRPDIVRLLEYIRAKDIFSIRISTNGMLLRQKRHVLPLVDTLAVSIDALRIAQYPRETSRMLDDLAALRDEFGDDLPRIVPSWTTSSDDDFDKDIKPLLDYSRKNEFIVKFLPLKVNQYADWVKQREIVLSALDYVGERYVTNQYNHTVQLSDEFGRKNCLVVGNQYYVDIEGNFLYPCDEYSEYRIGSVHDHDVATLFDKAVAVYGEFPRATGVCAHCPSGCHSDDSYIFRNPKKQLAWLE